LAGFGILPSDIQLRLIESAPLGKKNTDSVGVAKPGTTVNENLTHTLSSIRRAARTAARRDLLPLELAGPVK
jgi:hypothetical protein